MAFDLNATPMGREGLVRQGVAEHVDHGLVRRIAVHVSSDIGEHEVAGLEFAITAAEDWGGGAQSTTAARSVEAGGIKRVLSEAELADGDVHIEQQERFLAGSFKASPDLEHGFAAAGHEQGGVLHAAGEVVLVDFAQERGQFPMRVRRIHPGAELLHAGGQLGGWGFSSHTSAGVIMRTCWGRQRKMRWGKAENRDWPGLDSVRQIGHKKAWFIKETAMP